MHINFYPESDLEDYIPALKTYSSIWEKDKDTIIRALEKHSHKTFREKTINAVVGKFISHSLPLSLNCTIEERYMRYNFVHELGHRVQSGCLGRKYIDSFESHQVLYLILSDAVQEIYGEKSLSGLEEWELRPSKPEHYKRAWDWVHQLDTYELRQEKLLEFYSGGE